MKRSKALLITTGAFHTDGGIAALNRLVIKSLADEGYTVEIHALIENKSDIDIRYIPVDQVNYHSYHGNKYKFTSAVYRSVLSNQYEYVIVDHVNIASILVPLTWLRKLKYIVWLFGIEVFPPKPDFEGRLGFSHANKRIAISEFTRSKVNLQFPTQSIAVCDLCLDPVRHEYQSPATDIQEEKLILRTIQNKERLLGHRVILHVGRMSSEEKYKGQDILINCFPDIIADYPDAQLVLVGQGDDSIRLRNIAGGLPEIVQDSIFIPGFLSQEVLNRVYGSSYLFAMPSYGEGFGLVYLEAMLRGLPCIGSRVDAAQCIIRDGKTGILVDNPQSTHEVGGAIKSLFSNPDQASKMGGAGAELVGDYYLFEHFKGRFLQIIKS